MFNRPKLLLSIASLIARGNPRNDMNISDWLVLLLVADYKGWLYYAFDEDKLSMAAVAYRVKEVSEETNHNLPAIEEGDILFVPIVVSFTKDKSRIRV